MSINLYIIFVKQMLARSRDNDTSRVIRHTGGPLDRHGLPVPRASPTCSGFVIRMCDQKWLLGQMLVV